MTTSPCFNCSHYACQAARDEAPTARPTISRWDRRRDKYGRSIHVAITVEGGEYGHESLAGAVVSMPRVFRESHPGHNVMVNLYGKGAEPHRGEVTYWPSVAKAKAFFEANALTSAECRAAHKAAR